MKRLLPIVIFAVTYADSVRAADPAYQKKIDALMKKAQADRKAKGLDNNPTKLSTAYPAPEISLKPIDACPGATIPLTLTGKFPAGTAFVVQSDDVELKDEKSAENSWEGKLAVKPTATPQSVELLAISPVSGAQRALTALHIGCKQVWSFVLDTGEVLTVRAEFKGGKSAATGEGEWTKPGAKPDANEYEIQGSWGSFTFNRVVPQAEGAQRMQAMQQALIGPQGREISKRRNKANLALDECTHKWAADGPKMIECLAPVQAEMNAVTKEQETLMRRSAGGPRLGCEQVTVDSTDGKLTGMGDRCADGKTHKVTGSVKGEG